jgi:hypothetical protein
MGFDQGRRRTHADFFTMAIVGELGCGADLWDDCGFHLQREWGEDPGIHSISAEKLIGDTEFIRRALQVAP